MDGLKVPKALSGASIDGDEAIGKQVGARPVSAVEIVSRRAGRNVHDPALLIDAHFTPVVHSADILPRIRRPRVITELTGMRDGMERPREFSGQDVVRADIPGRRAILFAGRRADNN